MISKVNISMVSTKLLCVLYILKTFLHRWNSRFHKLAMFFQIISGGMKHKENHRSILSGVQSTVESFLRKYTIGKAVKHFPFDFISCQVHVMLSQERLTRDSVVPSTIIIHV